MFNKEYGTNIEIKVGILLGVGVLLAILTLLFLREGSFIFSTRYTLKVKMDTVEGLGPGSLVQMLGVPIGNVGTVTPLPSENKVLINLSLDRNYQNMITKNSTINTTTQGMLGDKFISINPHPIEENNKREILQDGDFLLFQPKTTMFSVLSSEGDKIEDLFVILKEMSILVKDLNANNKVAQIMYNLNDSSQELKTLIVSLRQWVDNTKGQEKLVQSLDHLSSVLKKIDDGQGTLGALINDSSLYDRIDHFLSGSQRQTYVKELVRKTIQTGKD